MRGKTDERLEIVLFFGKDDDSGTDDDSLKAVRMLMEEGIPLEFGGPLSEVKLPLLIVRHYIGDEYTSIRYEGLAEIKEFIKEYKKKY